MKQILGVLRMFGMSIQEGWRQILLMDIELIIICKRLPFGYTFLKDDVKNLDISYSQYSVNSLKHHLTANYTSQFVKNVTQTLVYKYAERTSGDSYAVVDANVTVSLRNLEVYAVANNIFNTAYTETNMVPMPKGNMLFGLRFFFR